MKGDKFITVYSCHSDNIYIVIRLCFCYTECICEKSLEGL